MHCKNCRNWVLLVARIFIGLIFVFAAYGKFTGMDGVIGYIGSTWIPFPTFMAWTAAIVELVGGLALILGFHANAAALILAVFLLVVNLTFHFDLGNQGQITQLLKNFAVIGGLLYIHVTGAGKFKVLKCKCCHECDSDCKDCKG